jgi:hypothetical protein
MSQYFELPEYSAILTFLDAVLAEINMGIFIYHLEDHEDERKLKLIYANKEASICTGSDMSLLVGKYILEAFPALGETEIPKAYRDVVVEGKSRRIGTVEYEDANLKKRSYAVRAFPMPAGCMGVLFESLSDDGSRGD